jgi:hypothetical protein
LQENDAMTKTVTSLFQTEQHATAAATRLEQAGISRTAVDIWSTPHNLAPLLEDEGLSRHDAYAYAEGVIRGGSVIIVKCDEAEVAKVVSILDQEGVQDLDEQQASWRSEGWEGHAAPGIDATGSPDETEIDIDAVGRSDEVHHGRFRVLSRRSEHPGQK